MQMNRLVCLSAQHIIRAWPVLDIDVYRSSGDVLRFRLSRRAYVSTGAVNNVSAPIAIRSR